ATIGHNLRRRSGARTPAGATGSTERVGPGPPARLQVAAVRRRLLMTDPNPPDTPRNKAAAQARWFVALRPTFPIGWRIAASVRNETTPLSRPLTPSDSDDLPTCPAGATSDRKAEICRKPATPTPRPRRWCLSTAGIRT